MKGLLSISTPLLAVACMLLGGAIAGIIVTLVHKHRRADSMTGERNNLLAVAVALIGSILGILLSFLVTIVWQDWSAASGIAEREADTAYNLYRLSARLPSPTREQINEATVRYLQTVAERDWQDMDNREQTQASADALHSMWTAAMGLHAAGTDAADVYDKLLQTIADLAEARRHRLLSSRAIIPSVMWIFLIFASASLIALLSFYETRHRWMHFGIVVIVAATLSFLMFIVAALDRPFGGRLGVQPDAVMDVLKTLQRNYTPAR